MEYSGHIEEIKLGKITYCCVDLNDESFKKIGDYIKALCAELGIDVPYVSISENLTDQKGNVYLGYTFHPKDWPVLDKPLVILRTVYENILNFETKNRIQKAGITVPVWRDMMFKCSILHELRHIWQEKYHANVYFQAVHNSYAHGKEVINDRGEIDADAFAIAYESREYDLEMVASFFCKDEYNAREYSDGYSKRIDRAKELLEKERNEHMDHKQESMINQNISEEKNETSFFSRLLSRVFNR